MADIAMTERLFERFMIETGLKKKLPLGLECVLFSHLGGTPHVIGQDLPVVTLCNTYGVELLEIVEYNLAQRVVLRRYGMER